MTGGLSNRILKTKLRKRDARLIKAGKRIQTRENQNKELKSELRRTRQELAEITQGMVVEWCSECEQEVMLVWDKKDGLSAFCPYCGSRLMLCSECDHPCDYDYGKDVCSEM